MNTTKAAALSALVLGCGAARSGVISGSVTYRERMALPPDAVVEVRLSDVSRQDVAAPVIADTTILPEGRQVPLPFELRYAPGAIQPDHTYAVRATIRSGGRIIFTTDAAYHVITRGNPTQADLRLVRVTDGEQGVAEVAPPPTAFRVPPSRSGRMVLAAEELRFIACGETGTGRRVEDLPDGEGKALVREFAAGENGIAVMVRLDGNRLQQIRYAGPEGPRCEQLPPEGAVEARGNEPFWFIRVDGTAARFRSPGQPGEVGYSDGTWTRLDEMRWRYEARGERGAGSESLTLELTEARCVDSMSGARYPFRALLIRNDDRTEGCALEGRRSVGAMDAR